MLTYANVGASYGGFNVLRDISFTISSPVVSGIFLPAWNSNSKDTR